MKKKILHLFIILFICACSSTKYVPENEQLLVKNSIIIDQKKNKDNSLEQYIIQRPNAKAITLPVSLYFYNLGNPNGSEDAKEWKKNHKGLYNTAKYLFSEKQSIALANSFVGLNNWFLKNGQAPVIIDDEKTKKSEKNLKEYFQNKGYFNSKVESKKENVSSKKGKITYSIKKGSPLIIEKVNSTIKSKILDSIYNQSKSKSFLKINQQYDNQNFVDEAKRLTKLFRNKGIYHFNVNSIDFIIDTLNRNNKGAVNTKIKNFSKENYKNIKTDLYQIQKIKSINVVTDYLYNLKDSTPSFNETYKKINFKSFNKQKYNPKFLSESIFIKPNQIYTDSLRNLSKNHLRGLKNFKSVSIRYKELNSKELEANIYLSPIEKYTLSIENELSRSNIRNYDIATKFSLTNRNTFRGAEITKFSAQGGYFDSNNGPGWELGINASLEVPRFMAPFRLNKIVSKSMFPKTRFLGGTSIQRNIGLDKQNFNLGIEYNWNVNSRKRYQFELLNTQYVKNFNVKNYFDIYRTEYNKLLSVAKTLNYPASKLTSYGETVGFMQSNLKNSALFETNFKQYQLNKNVLNRHNIITSDFLIPVIAFSFIYNTKKNIQDQNFLYIRTRVANSGNIIGFISSQKNDREKRTLFEIPIAQYFKADIEFKKFWRTSNTSTLGFRIFTGAIFNYNKSDIPFSKSYFAGGSNDIRAWRTYDLGPGAQTEQLKYNIGSFKLLGNLEYRFDIIGALKGALFIDSGNIWDITNSPFIEESGKLNDFSSLGDIAVGSGFGIRYDLKFLVARFDIGFKTREPYRKEEQWFQSFDFDKAQYNIGINYPF